MSKPVLLVFGGTGRVGGSVATRFIKEGYNVALASRSAKTGPREDGAFLLQLDLSKPELVDGAFKEVNKHFGQSPSVVVYNAYAVAQGPSPISYSLQEFTDVLSTNTISLYAALKAAVEHRPKDTRLTFINTGNYFHTRHFFRTAGERIPFISSLAVGKNAGFTLLETVAPTLAKDNVAIFFADERTPEGDCVWEQYNEDAHAEYFLELVRRPADKPGPVNQVFVAGKGQTSFAHDWQV